MNTKEQVETFKAHILALGFTPEQVLDVALVMQSVAKEPGFHLWRFNAPLRAIARRLVQLTILRREGDDLYDTWEKR